MSVRAIVVGGVLVGLVAAVAVAALLYLYGGGTDQDRAGLDLVRTAGTLVVGAGGFIALLLAARRQRSTELALVQQQLTLDHQHRTLEHQREVAASTARDAVEQRITELYTRAVDQLGNGQAPVRLGGLHALERLAQNNSDQRQTIVDVICAYLRMPPEDKPPADDANAEAHTSYELRRQELQVRQSAQRILAAHLRPDAVDAFWPGIHLDLAEAHLHRLDLTNCHIQKAQFDGAKFDGGTWFEGAQFDGDANFIKAQFRGGAHFDGARFGGSANFPRARFPTGASFLGARFGGYTAFIEAQFGGASFSEAQFGGQADFGGARFDHDVFFTKARFEGPASFGGGLVMGDVWFGRGAGSDEPLAAFDEAWFGGRAAFDGARARPRHHNRWPAGWTTRDARTAEGEVEGWMHLVPLGD